MFYMVRVTEEDSFMQLFIWKFSGEEKIRTFRMTRLVMGCKPSSNLSIIALKETAFINDNHETHPDAAKALVDDSYVDNTFIAKDTHKELFKVIAETEEMAKVAGFFYKPWVVSGDDVPDQQLVNVDDVEEEKALGIHWDVKNDKLFVRVRAGAKKKLSFSSTIVISLLDIVENPTLRLRLRDCLSLHARAWDPLGIILPVKMNGSLLFRETLQHLNSKAKAITTENFKTKQLPKISLPLS